MESPQQCNQLLMGLSRLLLLGIFFGSQDYAHLQKHTSKALRPIFIYFAREAFAHSESQKLCVDVMLQTSEITKCPNAP